MQAVLDCGAAVIHDRIERDQRILIEDGVIRAIAAHLDAPAGAARIDARDATVVPGFIDVHVHGALDADAMDASPGALRAMARFYTSRGVTSFLPTTMTAPRAHIDAALATIGQEMNRGGADEELSAQILGAHVEGPFINPKRCGAQAPDQMRPADPAEYLPWFESGAVKLITVAPEIDGCMQLIMDAARYGVAVAIGHTDATFDQAQAAFAAGANQATHTYNAMRGLHHREPGTLGAVMVNDAAFAQLICDNVHVHPAAMLALYRCKGPDKIAVITDAMEATGLGDGDFVLAPNTVYVRAGVARLANGALAGSTLTMDVAFRNIIAATGCSVAEAARMCSSTPAASIGLAEHKGRIAPGFDADLVILDRDLRVVRTIVAGRDGKGPEWRLQPTRVG
jgi:N-acetylglucosamine-6-phosphate deacetylase